MNEADLHELIDTEVEWSLIVRWNDRMRKFEVKSLDFDYDFTLRTATVVPKYVDYMLQLLNRDIERGRIEDVLA